VASGPLPLLGACRAPDSRSAKLIADPPPSYSGRCSPSSSFTLSRRPRRAESEDERKTEFSTGGRGRRRRRHRPRRGEVGSFLFHGWIGSCCNQIGGLLIDGSGMMGQHEVARTDSASRARPTPGIRDKCLALGWSSRLSRNAESLSRIIATVGFYLFFCVF
jgi:hypothetical protein